MRGAVGLRIWRWLPVRVVKERWTRADPSVLRVRIRLGSKVAVGKLRGVGAIGLLEPRVDRQLVEPEPPRHVLAAALEPAVLVERHRKVQLRGIVSRSHPHLSRVAPRADCSPTLGLAALPKGTHLARIRPPSPSRHELHGRLVLVVENRRAHHAGGHRDDAVEEEANVRVASPPSADGRAAVQPQQLGAPTKGGRGRNMEVQGRRAEGSAQTVYVAELEPRSASDRCASRRADPPSPQQHLGLTFLKRHLPNSRKKNCQVWSVDHSPKYGAGEYNFQRLEEAGGGGDQRSRDGCGPRCGGRFDAR